MPSASFNCTCQLQTEVPLLSASSHFPSSPSLGGFSPHFRFACSSLSHCLLSPLAEYTLFLLSLFSLLPWAWGCFHLLSVYEQSGQAAGFCISDILRPAQSQSRLQEAPWAPFVRCLDWGLLFSINLIAT